ncbi:MAG TPA: hypothetical protein VG992_02250 [Candidatus Saccharimonadales bacterium]|nr:hypothetical protein [Candidatus Saccharimonadales bacterium]
MGEYLTQTEAQEVRLPRLNVFARRRIVAQYMGELTAGMDMLAGLDERLPKNRFALIMLAADRERLDRDFASIQLLQDTRQRAEDAVQQVTMANRQMMGLSNDPDQLEIVYEGMPMAVSQLTETLGDL